MKSEDILKELAEAKSRIEFLENELRNPEQFKFIYKEDNTYAIYSGDISGGWDGSSGDLLNNFRYRQTEVNAKADFQLQKELMCIGALAEQVDPDYKSKVSWAFDREFYSIHQDMKTKEYQVQCSYPKRRLGVVYMPKDVAEKVCEILNNNRVTIN